MIALGNVSALVGRLRACPSSSAETCLALWAGRAPEPEPLSAASQRLARRMPQHAREQMALLDRALPAWPLRAMKLLYDAHLDVEPALARLHRRRASELDVALLSEGAVAAPADARAASSRRSGSPALALTILEVIDCFWRQCFADVWEMQGLMLDDIARQLGPPLVSNPVGALERLTPRARSLQSRDALFLASSQQSGTLDCAELRELEILPTLWLRRGAVVVETMERIGLCIHARRRRALESFSTPRLVQAMNVLGDPQRFEIVRLCSSRPRSTQDLSRLLGITPAPVSRHLSRLKDVHLIVGRRVGRFVLYEVIPETLALAAAQLQELSGDAICESEDVARLHAGARLPRQAIAHPAAAAPGGVP